MIGLSSNRCELDGELFELEVLRYTPAGIPRIGLKNRHVSTQQQAVMARQLMCTVPALALGEAAVQVSRFQLGQTVHVTGFLAQRSLRIAQLVLHIDNITLK